MKYVGWVKKYKYALGISVLMLSNLFIYTNCGKSYNKSSFPNVENFIQENNGGGSNNNIGSPQFPDLVWSGQIQFGLTPRDYERTKVMRFDSQNNLYMAGDLNIGGFVNAHIFLNKYDRLGQLQWSRQLASNSSEGISDIAVSDDDNKIYIVGHTNGNLAGPNSAQGSSDMFIAQYDSTGTQQWIKQLGWGASDLAKAVVIDSAGFVYVGGGSNGMSTFTPNFNGQTIIKFDSAGNQIWAKQWGNSPGGIIRSMAIDENGHIYALGNHTSMSGDFFIAQLDTSGNVLWINTSITNYYASDRCKLVLKLGKLSVIAETRGDADGNGADPTSFDAVVAQFDLSGNQLWLKQIRSTIGKAEWLYGLDVDADGAIYISGHTEGSLFATNLGPYQGYHDIFMQKIDMNGNVVWSRQIAETEDVVTYTLRLDRNNEKLALSIYASNWLGTPAIFASPLVSDGDTFVELFDLNGNML